MITYDKYAEIRDSKGFTDGKIAKMCGFGRSTFSDWKAGRSIPKFEKMRKIAEALQTDYSVFVGPIGKFSSLKPSDDVLKSKKILVEAAKMDVPLIPDYLYEYMERIRALSGPSQEKLKDYLKFLETTEKPDEES